jgi:nucleotide-binding universal stress UspA family protein
MRFERLLFVVAPGDVDPAPAWSQTLALARRAGASVTLLGVAREASADLAEAAALPAAQLARIANDELRETLAALVGANEDVALRVEAVAGVPFVEVIRAALRERCDLVVVPAGGCFGSTIAHLIRKCPAPVWAVRGVGSGLPARIAVAIEADPEVGHRAFDRKLAETALAVAGLCESELHVLHAFAPTPSAHTLRHRAGLSDAEVGAVLGRMRAKRHQWLEALLEGRSPAARPCFLRILDGEPGVEIPREVARLSIELLVLGTVGRSGLAGMLIGNTAEEILRRVDCSVLALKPDGFQSPVKP